MGLGKSEQPEIMAEGELGAVAWASMGPDSWQAEVTAEGEVLPLARAPPPVEQLTGRADQAQVKSMARLCLLPVGPMAEDRVVLGVAFTTLDQAERAEVQGITAEAEAGAAVAVLALVGALFLTGRDRAESKVWVASPPPVRATAAGQGRVGLAVTLLGMAAMDRAEHRAHPRDRALITTKACL